MRRCKSDEEQRRIKMESRLLAVEQEIARLKKDLSDGQKVLDEGTAVFHDLQRRHKQNVTMNQFRFLSSRW